MNLLTWDILWSPNQKIHTKPAFSALFTSLPSITIAGHHLDILAPFLRLAKTIFPIRLSWNTPDFCLSCHITCTNLQRKKNLVFLQSFSKVNKRVESMKSIQFNIIKNQHSPTAHVEQIIISPPTPNLTLSDVRFICCRNCSVPGTYTFTKLFTRTLCLLMCQHYLKKLNKKIKFFHTISSIWEQTFSLHKFNWQLSTNSETVANMVYLLMK